MPFYHSKPTQSSSEGAEQAVADAVSEGVENLCNCGFFTSNINQIKLQCFPDNLVNIDVQFVLQATPTRNISDIVDFLVNWIASNPQIVLDTKNTTVRIDRDCDVTSVEQSECSTTLPPTLPSTGTSESQTKLMVVGLVVEAFVIVAVLVVVLILVVMLVKRRRNNFQ